MIGSKTAQVFAEHPRTTGRDPQMMNGRSGLKINPLARIGPPVRKLGFKIVGDPHESFVETTNFDGGVAAYGKISCHKLVDPSRSTTCKVEPTVARKINSFLPRLDDTTGH